MKLPLYTVKDNDHITSSDLDRTQSNLTKHFRLKRVETQATREKTSNFDRSTLTNVVTLPSSGVSKRKKEKKRE